MSGPGPPEESIVIVSFKRHKYLITLHGSNFMSEVEKGEKEVDRYVKPRADLFLFVKLSNKSKIFN